MKIFKKITLRCFKNTFTNIILYNVTSQVELCKMSTNMYSQIRIVNKCIIINNHNMCNVFIV